jgi:Fe-S-cluster containining protein
MKQQKQDSCTCEKCVGACEHNPGWMTPQEARAAIRAGLANRLMRDWLEPSDELGNETRVWVLAPASIGCEGEDAPEMPFMAFYMGWSKGRCTFLKNGRCEIHDSGFKPIHCRVALACDQEYNIIAVNNFEVARLWDSDLGRQVIEEWTTVIDTAYAAA